MLVKVNYEALHHQDRFHFSEKPKVYLSAGYGAGKTFSLVMKELELMMVNAPHPGGLLSPDLKMFKRDVWPTILQIANENFDPPLNVVYRRQESELYFPDYKATIYIFHSEDDGQSIRGPNLAYMGINEISLCSHKAFLAAIARVRLKKATKRQIIMSGTPEEFNWAYEYFIEHPREDTELIFGSSRDNVFVADDYIKMLEESYDDLMRQQYVDGQYVNLKGMRAAHAFDRFKHVKEFKYIPGNPIFCSLDFNIYPMAAALWHQGTVESTYKLGCFKDFKIDGSDTEDFCGVLKQYLTDIGAKLDDVTIYPDPAGGAGSTKSKGHKSDIDILKEQGFKNIKYHRSIRSVRDCLNATNRLLARNEVIIDPSARNLISDLEQCKIKEGSYEIDKSDSKRSHWLDGAKNMIEYEFPIMISRPEFRQTRYR